MYEENYIYSIHFPIHMGGVRHLIFVMSFFILCSAVMADEIFYETFDDANGVALNNGTVYGSPKYVKGIVGNGLNISNYQKVCYPMDGNFYQGNGSIEMWVKIPMDASNGFFDIGYLGNPNTMGIFKSQNHLIMEVKDQNNAYSQAWSSTTLVSNMQWHHLAAVWTQSGAYMYFKVCIDGACKMSYDGARNNVYLNNSNEFCIGFGGWYGYSRSVFDEVRIYDNVRTNSEILADYEEYKQFTNDSYNPKECVMYKNQSKGPVKLNCTGLYVNGEKFTAKGVGYQPIPIGMTATSIYQKQTMYDDRRITARDFPLLRKMNANTIRVWGEVLNESFLDDAYNDGIDPIYVVMGFWIECNEIYYGVDIRKKYIGNFTEYVKKYKDHPAVLMWAIGNENNLDYCSNQAWVNYFYTLGNDLAKISYSLEGENYHPVGIVNGDLGSLGLTSMKSSDEILNHIDYWGINVYPGRSFGDWFDNYNMLSGKPLLITEYGIDALNNTNQQEYEPVHSEWVIRQWREINSAESVIGSTVMAYSDEWWKAGAYYSHNPGGYSTSQHPDGYSNEEWWGVMRTVDNGTGPDIMQPRQLYYDFQREWKEKRNFTIYLNDGWNLISIPLELDNASISSVFKEINYSGIFGYDNGWHNVEVVNNTKGYWLGAVGQQKFTIEGYKQGGLGVELNHGLQLVGLPSVYEHPFGSGKVFMYDNIWESFSEGKAFNALDKYSPGRGYWVIYD